jgi:uncharacterized coiled-coil protein SlyX
MIEVLAHGRLVQAGEDRGITMFAWLRRLVQGKRHEARIGELEMRAAGVDVQLGHLERRQNEHKAQLETLDRARIARLTDRQATHERAGGR